MIFAYRMILKGMVQIARLVGEDKERPYLVLKEYAYLRRSEQMMTDQGIC